MQQPVSEGIQQLPGQQTSQLSEGQTPQGETCSMDLGKPFLLRICKPIDQHKISGVKSPKISLTPPYTLFTQGAIKVNSQKPNPASGKLAANFMS